MNKLVILGAGTAGTMLSNTLRRALDSDWSITVIDQDDDHQYQPGFLFVPFGKMPPARVTRSRRSLIPDGVDFIQRPIAKVHPHNNLVELADGGEVAYDWLIIASGCAPRPEATPGLTDERVWRKSAHDFYTLDGATRLRDAMALFEGGRVLVHVSEMPIKCPVAPLEFAFLADDYFRKRRMRHKVDITYVTPLDGAFTKPVASSKLGGLLEDRSIRVQTDFAVESVDPEQRTLNSYDGRALPFDLLVTVPVNMGAQFVIDSGLGDDLGYVPVNKHTLRADQHANIFVVGDAANVPTSKAGAVAHFEVEMFTDNFLAAVQGKPLPNQFDGHANCFVEAGRGQALLLDFNYDTEPLTGVFPHLGKLAFEHIYWNMLMKGRRLPVPTEMSMRGKIPAGKES